MTFVAPVVNESNQAQSVPTRETLLERARALVPVLKSRARETEQLGRIPDETVRDLREAGLFRVGVPELHGGYKGVDYPVAMEIAMELGRGCGSTAWCYNVWVCHPYLASAWARFATKEYYAAGPDALSSTARSTVWEELEPTDDGFILSGEWGFSSGCDHSEWFLIFVATNIVLVPRAQVEIVDGTWDTLGMRGTGSKNIRVNRVYIPDHRLIGVRDADMTSPPGFEYYGSPASKFIGFGFIGAILAPLVGAAQGAVDTFTEMLRGTSPKIMSRTANSKEAATHIRLAEASAEVDLARLLLMTDMAQLTRISLAGEQLTLLDRTKYRRNNAMVAQLCLQAVNRLFEPVGGKGVVSSNPLLRYWRDVHTAAHHAIVMHDFTFEQYGRAVFGLPVEYDPLREMVDMRLKNMAELMALMSGK